MARPALKDSLFLGFCAALIVVTRSALRLHLGIPGHAMFFTIFFLMLARGTVNYRFSASFTGLVSGLIAVLMGLGKGGPLILTKFLMPAVVIDICAAVLPGAFTSHAACALIAAAASATKFMATYLTDILFGMDRGVTVRHAALQTLGAVAFGVAGGLLVVPVMRKLKARGVI
jgi:hypothetical protein